MTQPKADFVTLDWRTLAPAQVVHVCDCGYCEEVGELEPIAWPDLTRMVVDGVEYITDRYLAVLAEHAPIPEGYEGPILGPVERPRNGFMASEPLLTQARGIPFRWQTIRAVEATGWQLRLLDDHPRVEGKATPVAVFAADNETHIGWAMSAREAYEETEDYGDADA